MTNFTKVIEFCALAGQKVERTPTFDKDTFKHRKNLITKEYAKLIAELDKETPDFARISEEIVNLLYAAYGTAVELGINVDKVFDTVHSNNMNKFLTDKKSAQTLWDYYSKMSVLLRQGKPRMAERVYNGKLYYIITTEYGEVVSPLTYSEEPVFPHPLEESLALTNKGINDLLIREEIKEYISKHYGKYTE